jgi:D-3-phosphoglycerate dehydrogenase
LAFKVVATPFRRGATATYQHELESLAPLGVDITVVNAETDEEWLAQAKDADAVIVGGRRLNGDLIRGLEKCKVFASGAVGVDTIDVDAATEKGIVICNCPDVFIEEVAVHAMMLLLGLAKKVVPLDRAVREGRWAEGRKYMKPMPRVVGDTLGLVAFGNIPRLVAKKAKGFDMKILAWDPFVPAEVFKQQGVEQVTDLKDLFRRSDFVSAHLPYNPQTKGVLNYDLFSVMKPTAYFINTGRGQTQVDADLIRALNEGKLAGAGLDVMDVEPLPTDSPLVKMDNVILTPHSANVSDWGDIERRRRVGQEIAAVLQGRMPKNVANRDVLKKVNLAQPVTA